jgi:acetyl esterase/lipase
MMDLTDAYANGTHIPGGEGYFERWVADAAAFRERAGNGARLDIAYGPGPRQKMDLFLPAGAAAGLVVFMHGGYWMATDKSVWSHLAAGPVTRGWAVAMPSYTLGTEARIGEITREIAIALERAAAEVPGPIVVTGHSAGGHLAARMRCADVALPQGVPDRLWRVLPISPLGDLRPLLQTDMRADLRLDTAQAAAESPVLCTDLRDVDTVVWVGAEERPVFLDQARWLADAWPQTTLRIAPGRHHFDVLEEMEQPDTPLMRALVGG